MKILPFSRIRTAVIYVAALLFAGWIGYQFGVRSIDPYEVQTRPLIHTNATGSNPVDFSIFWDVWEKIGQYYIDSDDINIQKLVYGAVSGMVAAVDDPYTSFFPPQEHKEFKEDLGGSFEGIGAQLGLKDSRIIIVAPLRGMPAEKAGLKPNDYILKVDGKDTTGWTIDQAVDAIRGPRGTDVTLTILHGSTIDKPKDIRLTRSTITVPSVTWWILPPGSVKEIQEATSAASLRLSLTNIAYIALTRFGDNTNADWNKAVDEIIAAKQNGKTIAGLILDMRSNTDLKVAVLVDAGSASAAEIVAGALRDSRRATIIGQTTFGKGTVQTPFDVAGGASVHITTGKWLLPKGSSISNLGLKPDIEIDALEDFPQYADVQLAKAIEVLLQ